MIVTFFLTIAYAFISGLIGLLPASTGLPAGISTALAYIINSLNSFSYLIPVGALLGSLAVVILYEGGIWAFHGIIWIWKRLPFIGH